MDAVVGSNNSSGAEESARAVEGAKIKHSLQPLQNGKVGLAKDGILGEKKKPIRLHSPVGAQPFSWNWCPGKAGSAIGVEVLDILRQARLLILSIIMKLLSF